MQLTNLLTLAFASTALATTFKGFTDKSCEREDGTMTTVTAAQLQDLAVQQYPTATLGTEASRLFTFPGEKETCPSNKDDTYAWLNVPQWQEISHTSRRGGIIAVVYHSDTDTYYLCRAIAAVPINQSYPGNCA